MARKGFPYMYLYCPNLIMHVLRHQSRTWKCQNGAAQFSTGTKKSQHRPHLMIIDFKILLLTYKAVSGSSLVYIFKLMTPQMSERNHRSPDESSKGRSFNEGSHTSSPKPWQVCLSRKIFSKTLLFKKQDFEVTWSFFLVSV